MKTDQIYFSRQLIKGRVAEIIFEQLLRDAGLYTVLSFGYENILPELMHRQNEIKAKQTMEIIRRAPDFAVINNESHDVQLIEVKFMRELSSHWILKYAERMIESWKPSYLFVATPDGFYCDKVVDIVENKGGIKPLDMPHVSENLQEKYVKLLNEFLGEVECST